MTSKRTISDVIDKENSYPVVPPKRTRSSEFGVLSQINQNIVNSSTGFTEIAQDLKSQLNKSNSFSDVQVKTEIA
jgi:hypothetical protein